MMSLHEDSGHTRPRPHPQALAGPYLEFDLAREIDQLTCESQSSDGQNAKTLVKYDDLRIVLMVLKAQARVPDHKADGRISIHTLRGHIRMRALGRTFDLPAGSLLSLDRGLTHDVEALEDSALLLTVARRGGDGD